MSKRALPIPPTTPVQARAPRIIPSAADRWLPGVRALDSGEPGSIDILDPIGPDFFGEGVTAKSVAAKLREHKGDVTVNINSPGGFFDEGLAIYNLLRLHPGKVTVRVLGVAASAASVVAMAGDTIQIGRAAFLMVHNGWVVAMGDRHTMRAVADYLEPFDLAMASVYAGRSGQDEEEVAALMDRETWIGGAGAIELGLADELLPADVATVEESADAKARSAKLRIDAKLQEQGFPRALSRRVLERAIAGDVASKDEIEEQLGEAGMSRRERRALLRDAGMRDAPEDGTRDAAVVSGVQEILARHAG